MTKGSREGKLISVIVTAYNIEPYISRCLDSILSQTYTNLEIIVVDDGSEDRTGEICDKYEARDKRIKVIHQRNEGPSGARNAALAIAEGDYIGYVDGDDWVEQNMYREMYYACEQQGADVAICSYRQIGNGKERDHFSNERYILSREQALDTYICDDKSYHIYHSVWSKLFRKSVVENIRFSEGRKSEDIMYTTQALMNCHTCIFLDTPYYNYMTNRNDSIMNREIEYRRFRDEIPFWKEQIGYLEGAGMELLSRKATYQFYRKMLFYYIDFEDRKMRKSGREIFKMLRKERSVIRRIYGESFVKTGDRVRMRLFLFAPEFYYGVVKLYERIVIPLRQ